MVHSRRRFGILAAAATAALAGCTVQPLYSDKPIISSDGQSASMATELALISIKPVKTRYGQVVRNELIYMFGRGKGEPSEPKYSLALSVTSLVEGSTYRQSTEGETEPSSATLTMTGTYELTNTVDGSVVAKGKREAMSSLDRPQQSYADMRALRDAEDRAGKELAQQLRLAIAQDLSRR